MIYRTHVISPIPVLSIAWVGLAALMAGSCSRNADAVTPEKLEQQYGVSGAYTEDVRTADGTIRGTVVPVTLSDGRQAHLVIPARPEEHGNVVFVRDAEGLHPVEVREGARREDVAREPAIVERRPGGTHRNKRSWEKDALIIGGGAGAGTLIGAVAGGGKGAAVGATAGGIGGLIYDLATRQKK